MVCGIEDNDVGGVSDSERAALFQAQSGGGRSGHFVDGGFERDHALVSDIVAEDAGKRSVQARVGFAGKVQAVAADHLPRPLQNVAHIALMRGVMHIAGAKFFLFQQMADEFAERQAAPLRDDGESLALKGRVSGGRCADKIVARGVKIGIIEKRDNAVTRRPVPPGGAKSGRGRRLPPTRAAAIV